MLQGVGYPEPNLSHFRSIEIWDTASSSEQYLQDGWLTRTFGAAPTPRTFVADGVIIGSPDLGPLAGGGTRAIALTNTEQFLRQARLGDAGRPVAQQGARAHPQGRGRHHAGGVASVCQQDLHDRVSGDGFGNAMRTAAQVVANQAGVAVVRVTLSGFDTHSGQPGTQARLLGELADGIVALKGALDELGKWNDTLVLTYAEFGRRPKENLSNGTDHGTSSAHFALGGRVAGGTVRRAACARSSVRRRQSRLCDRFSQRVRDRARSLVGRAVDRTAWRQVRAGTDAARIALMPFVERRTCASRSRWRPTPRRIPASAAARSRPIFSRASETSVAYSPADSVPRSS